VYFAERKNFIMQRRQFLTYSATLMGGSAWVQAMRAQGFLIGACDWSIGKNADVGAIELAAQMGLDGVQVNMGSAANEMHLRQKSVQQAYLAACAQHGVKIGGLALGELNEVPFKSDDRTSTWVYDSVAVAKALDVKIVLLAFFGKNDLKNDAPGTARTIAKLKELMPHAEKNGIILGVESWLDAQEHRYILEQVASPNLKVYYDVANSELKGYDIYQEIQSLGSDQLICEFHAKEYDALLGEGKVNFARVRQLIETIGYRGWLHIENAVPPNQPIFDSYVKNNKFLRKYF
jgi:L-ribulose-5-phosphate 3-epimerase